MANDLDNVVWGYEEDGSEIRDPNRFMELLNDLNARHVRSTLVDTDKGVIRVSTLFLGFDSSGHEPPYLWETMVFGGPAAFKGCAWKHRTRQGALAGHGGVLEALRGELERRGQVVISEKSAP